MTSADPLKSVISLINMDDTSLAMPSGNQCKSGQQRVLEQVQTIRRTKSRPSTSSRNGSTSLSPTSPAYDFVFPDTPKSLLSPSSGSVFFGNGFSKTLSLERNINRQTVNNPKGPAVKRNTAASTYRYERSYAPVGSKAVGQTNTSRSEPDMARQHTMPKSSAPAQRVLTSKSTYRRERPTSQVIMSTSSQPQLQSPKLMNGTGLTKSSSQLQSPKLMNGTGLTKSSSQLQSPKLMNGTGLTKSSSQLQSPKLMNGTGLTKSSSQFVFSTVDGPQTFSKSPVPESAPKIKNDVRVNGNAKREIADITMKEAVEYLSFMDETFQHCGASYIQHNTFIDDKAKEEVLKLKGIPPLVALLRSPNTQVCQTASAALRNLSFKSNESKEVISRCRGITEAVALLGETESAETQKQLTGLLWNLSSVDSLKPDLVKSALPVLMERVILPYTTGPDQASIDADSFLHATECLRNLSSAKQNNRQAMRKCPGLIDSLVKYVRDCVEAEKPDDKSVENCMCILQNLTFQLETEAPTLFSKITASAKPLSKSHSQGDVGPIGCFSPQGKSAEQERHFDFPVIEDPQPSGAGWLIHSKYLQSNLSLLESSQQEETQEACCGALQNLTANGGIVSRMMSQIIVQKLNGLQVLAPLIKSNKVNLQRNVVALVGHLTKNPSLHSAMARKTLPELLAVLKAGTKEGNESDDTLAMSCQIANCLLMKEPEMGRHLLNNNLINSLKDLSHNDYFPKSKKAAALLLYNMWSEKDLQSFLKKQGMNKSSFVNDITTAVHKSVQIVD